MVFCDCHLNFGFLDRPVVEAIDERPEGYVIAALFNFVAKATRSYDKVDMSNKAWNLTGIDFIVTPIFVSQNTWNRYYMSYPYSVDDLTFATPKPEYSPEMMSLYQTLSLNVWLSLLASVVLFALVTFVVMKHRHRLVDVILHVIAIGLNQEGNLVARGVGEVLLLTTWAIAMTIFTLCFKSVLLSFLTFPPLHGVRTIPELAAAIRAGTYTAYTGKRHTLPSKLIRSPNEDIRSIGESMSTSPRGFVEYLIEDRSKEAFVGSRSDLTFTEGELYVSKDSMFTVYAATALGSNFCCREEMDMLMHRFLASGIDKMILRFRDHRKIWLMHDFLRENQKSGEETRKITLMDLSGAFLFLAVGHCISVIVLIVECMTKKRFQCVKIRN